MKHDWVKQNKKMKIIGLSESSSKSPSQVAKEMHKLRRELGKWKAKAMGSKAKVAAFEQEQKVHADTQRQWKRFAKKNEQLKNTLHQKEERMTELLQEREALISALGQVRQELSQRECDIEAWSQAYEEMDIY